MANNLQGLVVDATIVPRTDADRYPTTRDIDQFGGHRSVADLAARNAIFLEHRKFGMTVYVLSEDKTYTLKPTNQNLADNTNWVVATGADVTKAYTDAADAALQAQITTEKNRMDTLVANAPQALDTLKEIADQLAADEQGTAAILATQQQHTQQLANVVHKTGDETIAGVKTFSQSPQAPYPQNDDDVTTKNYVDDAVKAADDPFNAKTNKDNTYSGLQIATSKFGNTVYSSLWSDNGLYTTLEYANPSLVSASSLDAGVLRFTLNGSNLATLTTTGSTIANPIFTIDTKKLQTTAVPVSGKDVTTVEFVQSLVNNGINGAKLKKVNLDEVDNVVYFTLTDGSQVVWYLSELQAYLRNTTMFKDQSDLDNAPNAPIGQYDPLYYILAKLQKQISSNVASGDASYVHKTGDESIGGKKTFTSNMRVDYGRGFAVGDSGGTYSTTFHGDSQILIISGAQDANGDEAYSVGFDQGDLRLPQLNYGIKWLGNASNNDVLSTSNNAIRQTVGWMGDKPMIYLNGQPLVSASGPSIDVKQDLSSNSTTAVPSVAAVVAAGADLAQQIADGDIQEGYLDGTDLVLQSANNQVYIDLSSLVPPVGDGTGSTLTPVGPFPISTPGANSFNLPAGVVGVFDVNVVEGTGTRPLVQSWYSVANGKINISADAELASGDVVQATGYSIAPGAAGAAGPTSTDGLPEGTTNKYYTDARAKSQVTFANLSDSPANNASLKNALAAKADLVSNVVPVAQLPVATASTKGVVSAGSGLVINNGVLSTIMATQCTINSGGSAQQVTNGGSAPQVSMKNVLAGSTAGMASTADSSIIIPTAGLYYIRGFVDISQADNNQRYELATRINGQRNERCLVASANGAVDGRAQATFGGYVQFNAGDKLSMVLYSPDSNFYVSADANYPDLWANLSVFSR